MNQLLAFAWPISESAVERLGWVLVHSLWQLALVAVLASITVRVLRRHSAAARYGVLLVAMAVLVAAPVATYLLQPDHSANSSASRGASAPGEESNDSIQPRTDMTSLVGSPGISVPIPDQAATTVAPPMESPPSNIQLATLSWTERTTTVLRPWLAWIVAFWGFGVMLCSLRPILGWHMLRRLRREGVSPAPVEVLAALQRVSDRLGLRPSVRVLQSTLAQVPVMVGYLRPVILLPASLVTCIPAAQLEAILAHELAHVRRHDFVINLLQTLVETIFFYHPAVWWLSRQIRVEREHCCDDLVVQLLDNRVEYGRALVAIEQMRGQNTVLALGATDGSLLARVRRILGVGADGNALSLIGRWPAALLGLACLGVACALSMCWSLAAQDEIKAHPQPGTESPATIPPDANDFGPESNGLRCRLVAVPSTSDDESPDIAKSANVFVQGDDVTFAVELKNVSDQPLTLLGVRYADNYPAVKGKLNTTLLGPHLFEFEFTDAKGKPAPRTERSLDAESMILRGASAHDLAPGKSLIVLLRPAKFHAPMDYRLLPGSYRAKVRYRGPNDQTLAHINKHWPGKSQGKAWSKEAASNEAAFSVAADPNAPKPPQLVWGPVKEGLQAAIELRVPKGVAGIPTEPPGVPLQTKLGVVFHVKNVSDKPITFASESLRQGDYVHAKNEAGEELTLRDTWRTGGPIMVRWKLKPGDIAELPVLVPAINGIEQPGKYTVGYTVRFNDRQSKDDQGNITFPLKDDWQSELETGAIPLILRARTVAPKNAAGQDQEAHAEPTAEDVFARKVSLTAKAMPLKDALAAVARAARLELLLDVPALTKVGLDLGRPVTETIQDEPLGDALGSLINWVKHDRVLRELRGGKLHLTTLEAYQTDIERNLPDWLKVHYNRGLRARMDDERNVMLLTTGEILSDELLAKLKTLPKLRELEIGPTKLITPAGLSHLAELPLLQKISLHQVTHGGKGLGDAAIRGIIGSKSLRELHLNHCDTTDAGIRLLEALPQLTHLSLYAEPRVTDAAIASIAKLKQLKHLSLNSYVGTEHGWMRFSKEATAALAGLQNLEHLHLVGQEISPETLQFPRLKSLSLGTAAVDDASAARIAECRQLQTLDLVYTNISDDGLNKIADLPELVRLNLDSHVITDAGIKHLKKLPKLQHVSLRASQLTDESLRHLAEIKTLTRIDLNGSGEPGVNPGRRFTLAGVQVLKAVPQLRTLWLTNFESAAGILGLKDLTQLRELTLMMVNTREEELDALEDALPNTRINSMSGGYKARVPRNDRLKKPAQDVPPDAPAKSSLLGQAIEKFNLKAKSDPICKEQAPLTKKEVIETIRAAQNPAFPRVTASLFRSFQRIADTEEFPANAMFQAHHELIDCGDCVVDAWEVRLGLPKDDGELYYFTIRTKQLGQSRTLAAEADRLEKILKRAPALPGRTRLEDRVKELRQRAAKLNEGAKDDAAQDAAAKAAREAAARAARAEQTPTFPTPAKAADIKVDFEEVSIAIRPFAFLAREQPASIRVRGDGICEYRIEERPARGDQPKWDPAYLEHKLAPDRHARLEAVLKKTNWLAAAGHEGPATHTHPTKYTLTIKRKGITRSVTLDGEKGEPYKSLVTFFQGIALQENMLYRLERLPAKERQETCRQIEQFVRAEKGESYAKPAFEVDLRRFVPTFQRHVRYAFRHTKEEIVPGIWLLGHLRSETDREYIAALANDRDGHILEAVAVALGTMGGKESVPVLRRMVRSSSEAAWQLARLGPVAVPTIVKAIENGTDPANEREPGFLDYEKLIRAYLDHWADAPRPVDARVLEAVRNSMALPKVKAFRTEYHQHLLKLAAADSK